MKKYYITGNYICRQLMDNILLFPTNQKEVEFQGGVALNNVSYYVWKMLSEPQTKQDIVLAVSKEFNAEVEIVNNDIEELLDVFLNMKIVRLE